eukprot:3357947-Alexandrium_andersonii.AAC.1
MRLASLGDRRRSFSVQGWFDYPVLDAVDLGAPIAMGPASSSPWRSKLSAGVVSLDFSSRAL